MTLEKYFKYFCNLLEFYEISLEESLIQWKSTSNINGIYECLMQIVDSENVSTVTESHNKTSDSMNVGLKIAYASYKYILDLYVKSNFDFIVFNEDCVIELFKFIINWFIKLIQSKVKGELDYFFTEWFHIIKVTCDKVKNIRLLVVTELTPLVLNLLTTENLPMRNVKISLSHWNACLNFAKRHDLQHIFNKNDKFYKLGEVICSCGDYNVQAAILDTVFLYVGVLNNEVINRLAIKWFPSMTEIREFFINVPFKNFDLSCRSFLNLLNTTLGNHVKSLECDSVHFGNISLFLPKQSANQCFWFDCNIGTQCISISYFNILDKNERELIIITEDMVLQVILWHEEERNLTTIDFFFKSFCKDLPPFNTFDNWNCKLALTSSDIHQTRQIIEEGILRRIFGNSFQYLKVMPQQPAVSLDSNAVWQSFKLSKGSINKKGSKNLSSSAHYSSSSSADSSDPTKNLKNKLLDYNPCEYKAERVCRFTKSPVLSLIVEESEPSTENAGERRKISSLLDIVENSNTPTFTTELEKDCDDESVMDLLDVATNVGNVHIVDTRSNDDNVHAVEALPKDCVLQDEYVTSSSNSILGDSQLQDVSESDSGTTPQEQMNDDRNIKENLPLFVESQNILKMNKASYSNMVIYSSDDSEFRTKAQLYRESKTFEKKPQRQNDDSSSEENANVKISKSFQKYRIRKKPTVKKFSRTIHKITKSNLLTELKSGKSKPTYKSKPLIDSVPNENKNMNFNDLVRKLKEKLTRSPIMSSPEGSDILSEETVISSDQQDTDNIYQENISVLNKSNIQNEEDNSQTRKTVNEKIQNYKSTKSDVNDSKHKNKKNIEDNSRKINYQRRSTTSTVTEFSTINISESSDESLIKKPLEFVKSSKNICYNQQEKSAPTLNVLKSVGKMSRTPEHLNTSAFRLFKQKSSILRKEVDYINILETPESDISDMELTQPLTHLSIALKVHEDGNKDQDSIEEISSCRKIASSLQNVPNEIDKKSLDLNRKTVHEEINMDITENNVESLKSLHRTLEQNINLELPTEAEHIINEEKNEETSNVAQVDGSPKDVSCSAVQVHIQQEPLNETSDATDKIGDSSRTDRDNSTRDSLNKSCSVDSTASTVLLTVNKNIQRDQNLETIEEKYEFKHFKNISLRTDQKDANNSKDESLTSNSILKNKNETIIAKKPNLEPFVAIERLSDQKCYPRFSTKEISLSDTLDSLISSQDNADDKKRKASFTIDKNIETEGEYTDNGFVINLVSDQSDDEEMVPKRIVIKRVGSNINKKGYRFSQTNENKKNSSRNSNEPAATDKDLHTTNKVDNAKSVDMYDVSEIRSDGDILSSTSEGRNIDIEKVFNSSKVPIVNQENSFVNDKFFDMLSCDSTTKKNAYKFFKSKTGHNDSNSLENNIILQEKKPNIIERSQDPYDLPPVETDKYKKNKVQRNKNATRKTNTTRKENLLTSNTNKSIKKETKRKNDQEKENGVKTISVDSVENTITGKVGEKSEEHNINKSTNVDNIIVDERKVDANLNTNKANVTSKIIKSAESKKSSNLDKPILKYITNKNLNHDLENIINKKSMEKKKQSKKEKSNETEKDANLNSVVKKVSEINLDSNISSPINKNNKSYRITPMDSKKRPKRKLYTPGKDDSFEQDEITNSIQKNNSSNFADYEISTTETFLKRFSSFDNSRATDKNYSELKRYNSTHPGLNPSPAVYNRKSVRHSRRHSFSEDICSIKSTDSKDYIVPKYMGSNGNVSFSYKKSKFTLDNSKQSNKSVYSDVDSDSDFVRKKQKKQVSKKSKQVKTKTENLKQNINKNEKKTRTKRKTKAINYCETDSELSDGEIIIKKPEKFVQHLANVRAVEKPDLMREEIKENDIKESSYLNFEEEKCVTLNTELIENDVPTVAEEINPIILDDNDQKSECDIVVEPPSDEEYLFPKKIADKKLITKKKKQKLRYKSDVKKTVEMKKIEQQEELQIELMSNDVKSNKTRSSLSDVEQYVRDVMGDITFRTTDISLNMSQESKGTKRSKDDVNFVETNITHENNLDSDINANNLESKYAKNKSKNDSLFKKTKTLLNQSNRTILINSQKQNQPKAVQEIEDYIHILSSAESSYDSVDSYQMRVSPIGESFRKQNIQSINLPEDNYVARWISQVPSVGDSNDSSNSDSDVDSEIELHLEQIEDKENSNISLQNSGNLNKSINSRTTTPNKREERIRIKLNNNSKTIKKKSVIKSRKTYISIDSNLESNDEIENEINGALILNLQQCKVHEKNTMLNNSIMSNELYQTELKTPRKCVKPVKGKSEKMPLFSGENSAFYLSDYDNAEDKRVVTNNFTYIEDNCDSIDEVINSFLSQNRGQYRTEEMNRLSQCSPNSDNSLTYELKTPKKRKLYREMHKSKLNNDIETSKQKQKTRDIKKTITNNLLNVDVTDDIDEEINSFVKLTIGHYNSESKNIEVSSEDSDICDDLSDPEIKTPKRRKLRVEESETQISSTIKPVLKNVKPSVISNKNTSNISKEWFDIGKEIDSYITEDIEKYYSDENLDNIFDECKVKTPQKRKLINQKFEKKPSVTPKKRKLSKKDCNIENTSVSSVSEQYNSDEKENNRGKTKINLWFNNNTTHLSPIPSSLLDSSSGTSECLNNSDKDQISNYSLSDDELNFISTPCITFEKSRVKNTESSKHNNFLETAPITLTTTEKILKNYIKNISFINESLLSDVQAKTKDLFKEMKNRLITLSRNRSVPMGRLISLVLNIIQRYDETTLQVVQTLLHSRSEMVKMLNSLEFDAPNEA